MEFGRVAADQHSETTPLLTGQEVDAEGGVPGGQGPPDIRASSLEDAELGMAEDGVPRTSSPLSSQSVFQDFKDYFDEKHSVQKASRFIEDAFFGVKRVHPIYTQEALWWYVLHLRMYYVMSAVFWGYVLLTFFERPLWCIRTEDEGRQSDPCADPNYPTFNIPFLPRWGDLLLELLFLALLVLDLYVESAAYGKKLYSTQANRWFAGLLILAVCDVVYAYATPWTWFRLAPYLRIAMLAIRQKEIHGQLAVIYR